MLQHENFSWRDVTTPINISVFEQYLQEINYDEDEICFLICRFKHGFDPCYHGPMVRRNFFHNLSLRVGNKIELWNKVMKEVKLNRYAGPYDEKDIPLETLVQSPIGLVLTSRNKPRLIFHLSYDFGKENDQKSVNFHMPSELCMVKYKDLDSAV